MMIAADKMPFNAGDLVVYPTHGVGKITAIEPGSPDAILAWYS